MATLANTYRILDPYSLGSALTVNGPTAGGTGQPLGPDFTAPTIAAAMALAAILSSAYQRPVLLEPVGSPPPYTLVMGGAPGTVLTQVPSGIGY